MSECEHGKLIIPDLVQTAIKSVRKSKSVTAHAHHLSFHDYDVITKPFREALTQRDQKIKRLIDEVAALEKELKASRKREQAARKAAKTTIADCRRQGISMGRSLANWAAQNYMEEAQAAEAELERYRALVEGLAHDLVNINDLNDALKKHGLDK